MTEIRKIVHNGAYTSLTIDNYIGHAGDFILDRDGGVIRLMDGSTPGGQIIGGNGGGGGSLTGFVSVVISDAPNDTINASVLHASGTTDEDLILLPAGMGCFSLSLPTGDSFGGNKRGPYAVDLQNFASGKNSPTQVANGNYSFACNASNTASGQYSHVVGWQNTTSGDASHAEGFNNTAEQFAAHAEGESTASTGQASHTEGNGTVASANYAHAEGQNTTASGQASHSEGSNTTADGNVSHASGQGSHTRGIHSFQVYSSGAFNTPGDQQSGRLGLKGITNDASQKDMTADLSAVTTTNQITVPAGATILYQGNVVARELSTGNSAAYSFVALVKNDSGTVTIIGSPNVTTLFNDSSASAWAVALDVDNDNTAITIHITGADGSTIFWTAEVRTQELIA